jgi:hypothetical protein
MGGRGPRLATAGVGRPLLTPEVEIGTVRAHEG